MIPALVVLCEFEDLAVTSDAVKRIWTNIYNLIKFPIFLTNFKHKSYEFSIYD